ncbi:MAG: hypothetical protein KBT05_03140 [Bacteroidales bacterium]|nr:hypothetical protein [Candidatus Cryptobacteroides caccocaballi]
MTRKHLAYILVALFVLPFALPAQNRPQNQRKQSQQEDSLARLIQADTLQMVERYGITYRKVKGHAKFFHNNTYLICDSALWNVNTKVIDAMGHVQLKQEKTVLTSDNLTYYVDRDLAEFRGNLVQLVDADHNTLKTKYLDYNTKDSVAVFRNGGSMRDKDGQIIESRTGTYDSKINTFTFNDDVNMFTDSMFVKTSYLKYESDRNVATFGYNTNAWKDDNMLSANAGWYDRDREVFFFQRQVHVMSETQEAWGDSLYFHRLTNDVTMLGNVQVTDTTRNVYALAGKLDYVDSIGRTMMTRKPAVIAEMEEEQSDGTVQKDSLYFGADTLIYLSIRMCDVDSLEKVQAEKRLESVGNDPVTALRKQAAEAARKAAEEAAANDPNNPENARKNAEAAKKQADDARVAQREKPKARGRAKDETKDEGQGGSASDTLDMADTPTDIADSIGVVADTLGQSATMPDEPAADDQDDTSDQSQDPSPDRGMTPPPVPGGDDADSVSVDVQAPAEPLDTTKVGFVHAYRNVRMYRKSMQMVCDSLSYTDLDSLARLYYAPKIWNEEGRHQYSADSIYAAVVNQRLDKANLLSDAFIHIQEDTVHFDQIRSTEMTAFFTEDNALRRFDALGGVTAMFYLEENDVLATVNKKDCKMMSALFKDGDIEKVYYFETAKSDGYPVVQLKHDDMYLKGFDWKPDSRPKSRLDVTNLNLRASQRSKYKDVPEPRFIQTEMYFPGYIRDIHRQIEVRDSLNRIRSERDEQNRRLREQMETQERSDSLAFDAGLDSLVDVGHVAPDSLSRTETPQLDAPEDSTTVGNSPSIDPVNDTHQELTPEQIAAAQKAAAKAQKEREKAEHKAALEKKWAEKDAKLDAREAAKKEKAAQKLRDKKLKQLRAQARQDAKDQAKLEEWTERLRNREAKKAKKKH